MDFRKLLTGKGIFYIMKKTKEYIKDFRYEIIIEIILLIIIISAICTLDIRTDSIFNGSFIIIVLTLPVSAYNWISRKKEKFFDEKIEKLIKISEEVNQEQDLSEEVIALKLMQINDIYENRMHSADMKQLEEAITGVISNLLFNGTDLLKSGEMTKDTQEKIYSRLNFYRDDKRANKGTVSMNFDETLPMVNELFIGGNKPFAVGKVHIYLNEDICLNKIKIRDGIGNNAIFEKYVLLAGSTLNIQGEISDTINSIIIHDTNINIKDENIENIFDGVEYGVELRNKINIKDKELEELLNNLLDGDKDLEKNKIKEILIKNKKNIEDNLKEFLDMPRNSSNLKESKKEGINAEIRTVDFKIKDRKEHRKKSNKERNGKEYMRFSRNYSNLDEDRTGWFSLSKSTWNKKKMITGLLPLRLMKTLI